jgi:hypothetical protein
MKTATAPNVGPDRYEREWPASVPDMPDRSRKPVDARSFDPTLGTKIGSEPYDDPTQGRPVGSDPYNDATQGRTIGSDPEDDATRGSTLAARPYDDPTQGRQIGSDPYDDPTRGGSRRGRSHARRLKQR